MKKINKATIIGYILVVGVVVVGGVLFLGGKKESDKEFALVLEENKNSSYQTKLQAYKEKAENERRGGVSLNSSNSPFSNTSQIDSLNNIQHNIEEEQKQKSNQELQHNLIEARKQNAKIENNIYKKEEKITDEEYREIAPEIQNYYANKASGVKEQSEREKRKKAMEESWGIVGSNSTNTQATKNVNGFKAVIYGNQIVQKGGVIALRIMEDIEIQNYSIPRNTIVAGVMNVRENRLDVNIRSVRIGTQIIPIAFKVYGTDGVEGIPLDISVAGSTADKEVGRGATSEAERIARSLGGVVGGVAGSIVGGVGRATQREKDQQVHLVDNQTVILKSL